MEAAEEAAGATHIVAGELVLDFLQGVESRDADKERILAFGVVFIEEKAPHIEPFTFIHRVV